jgi:hypothetical protein
MNDRISDIARADRPRVHRPLGGAVVSADIIQFIPRPAPKSRPTDFPTIAFRRPPSLEANAATDCDRPEPDNEEDRTPCPKP